VKKSTVFIVAGVVLAVAIVIGNRTMTRAGQHIVSVSVPELSDAGRLGQSRFKTFCADCHGDSAGGSAKGPPLVHNYYHPGHHGDGAFFVAAKNGSRQHHWRFGDMPPVDGIEEADIAAILTFVREVQSANGIF